MKITTGCPIETFLQVSAVIQQHEDAIDMAWKCLQTGLLVPSTPNSLLLPCRHPVPQIPHEGLSMPSLESLHAINMTAVIPEVNVFIGHPVYLAIPCSHLFSKISHRI